MLAHKKDMPVSLEAVAQPVEASAETPPIDRPAHPEVQAPLGPPEAPEAPAGAPEPPSEPPPAPKRRGRPPKADAEKAKAKPKAATKREVPSARASPRAPRAPPPPPPDYGKLESSDSSSSDAEPLSRDDMETMLLSYLVQRKNQQIDKRRQMWTRVPGLG